MMRGTVYVILPRELMQDEVILRSIVTLEVSSARAFKAAAIYRWPSARLEFGPIGPPWSVSR
jgi:hypothetical protein